MGPRDCSRGNLGQATVAAILKGGFNGAARLLARKYAEVTLSTRHSAFASMGPRDCSRGNERGDLRDRGALPASMGPRDCSRGNAGGWVAAGGGDACFNGAARLLARKYSRADTGRSASPLLQWGRAIARAEIKPAAASSRILLALQWGRAIARAEIFDDVRVCFHKDLASMGPRDCSRGNGGSRRWRLSRRGCFNGAARLLARKYQKLFHLDARGQGFNGAARLLARKCKSGTPTVAHAIALQWGRAIARAEIAFSRSYSGATSQASMGPRDCSRGNQHTRPDHIQRHARFNGAARLLARKFRARRRPRCRYGSFNGAARLLARKSPRA